MTKLIIARIFFSVLFFDLKVANTLSLRDGRILSFPLCVVDSSCIENQNVESRYKLSNHCGTT